NDDGENEDPKIDVERHEIADAHRALNDKTPAERENHQRREVRTKNDDRNEAGKEPQNTQADVSGFRIGGYELFVLIVLRVDKPDERRSQYAFVDDLVQPIDRFLSLLEQFPHFSKNYSKRHADDRQHGKDTQGQLPV